MVEPDNANEGKRVGYLTEKLQACTLSPAALHLTATSYSTDCVKLLPYIFQTDLLSKMPKMTVVLLCRCIFDEQWWC